MKLSDFQLGWIAAAIDGEGHISFHHHSAADTFWGSVLIDNTDEAFIARAAEIMGPSVRMKKTLPRVVPTPSQLVSGVRMTKTSYRLTLSRCADLVVFLEQVAPHLVIKREKAEALLAWARGEPERRAARMGHLLASVGRSLVTDEERAEMVRLRATGMAVPGIARATGRTKETVVRLLTEARVDWRTYKKRMTLPTSPS